MSDEYTEIDIMVVEDEIIPTTAVPIPISIIAYDAAGDPLPPPPDNAAQAGVPAALHYGDTVTIVATYSSRGITDPLPGTVTYTNTSILVEPFPTSVTLPVSTSKVSQLVIILKTQKLNPSLGRIVFEVNVNIKVSATKTIGQSVSFVIDD